MEGTELEGGDECSSKCVVEGASRGSGDGDTL